MNKDVARKFARDTATHKVTIRHDHGLYRSVDCWRSDGGTCHHFCVTTWPGHIAITGDMGDYVFSRIPDMFAYVRKKSHETLLDQLEAKCDAVCKQSGLRKYAHEKLIEYVKKEREEDEDKDAEEWDELLVTLSDSNEFWNKTALLDFDINDRNPFDLHDWPDFTELSYHFEWCCYAIAWAVEKYDALKAAGASNGEQAPS